MDHVGYFVDLQKFDESDFREAIAATAEGGFFDAVVQPVPETVEEAAAVLCRMYAFAPLRPAALNFTVVFDQKPYQSKWKRVYGKPLEATGGKSFIGTFNNVAVGGTFDHLHWGHRLLLSMAAYSARSGIVVGVTSAALLVNKKYPSALESYAKRVDAVADFLKYIRPDLADAVSFYELQDMYGPTAVVRDLQALVVSAETKEGGEKVNEKRRELGFPLLSVVEVGLIEGTGGKLSSTDLRRLDVE